VTLEAERKQMENTIKQQLDLMQQKHEKELEHLRQQVATNQPPSTTPKLERSLLY